jgi:hypothetical protein
VHARPERKGEELMTTALYLQRPLIPFWLPPILLIALTALFFFLRQPPEITNFWTIPATPVAGLPVIAHWQVSNAKDVVLPQFTLTPQPSAIYEHEFQNAGTFPPNLRLVAISRFGVRIEATVVIAAVTQTPTSTPTPTPTLTFTPEPSATTAPTEEPAIDVAPAVQAPAVTQATAIPPPPTATPTPFGLFDCPRDVGITFSGIGPPLEPVLLYFGNRAVGGDTIGSDGTFRVSMRVVYEAGANYPITVRLRKDTSQQLELRSYQIAGRREQSLRGRSILIPARELTCVLPSATPAPTQSRDTIGPPIP